MTKNVFGWDLPPGVTQRMIDEQTQDDPIEESTELNEIEEEINALSERISNLNSIIERLHKRIRDLIDEQR